LVKKEKSMTKDEKDEEESYLLIVILIPKSSIVQFQA